MARTNDHNGRSGHTPGSGRPPVRNTRGGMPSGRPPQIHTSRPQPPRGNDIARGQEISRGRDIARVQGHRRRRRRQNYTLHYIALALLLTTLGVILSLTVFFRIDSIEVSGTGYYSEQQVLDALDAREGDNLLRLDLDRLEEDVRSRLVESEEISIRRRFPNTLAVEVTDAVITSQVLSGGFSYQISSGGRVVSIEQDAVPNVRIILGPDTRLLEPGDNFDRLLQLDKENSGADGKKSEEEYTNTRKLELLETLLNEIERAGLTDISMVDIRDSVNLKLLYQNRFEIRLGTSGDLQDKLAMFSSVLERGSLGLEETGILDISDPDRCIASRDLPDLPDGAAEAGWKWQGPHLENFDEFFGYTGSTVPPVESGVLVGGEEQNTEEEEISPDTSSPEEAPVEEEKTVSSESSGSTPGYMMPQMPNIGGQSSREPSSEPASEPSSEPEETSSPASKPQEESSRPAASSAPASEESSSSASSSPGYAMPQMPSVGR